MRTVALRVGRRGFSTAPIREAITAPVRRTVTAAAGRMIASEARSRSTARDEAQSQRERQWLPTTHGRVASHAACGLCCVITPIERTRAPRR